jgi:hypothetical protein
MTGRDFSGGDTTVINFSLIELRGSYFIQFRPHYYQLNDKGQGTGHSFEIGEKKSLIKSVCTSFEFDPTGKYCFDYSSKNGQDILYIDGDRKSFTLHTNNRRTANERMVSLGFSPPFFRLDEINARKTQ